MMAFAPLYSQNQKLIDSLLLVSESEISSKEKVDNYVALARAYFPVDSMSLYFYTTRAVELADSIRYVEGKVEALVTKAGMIRIFGDYHTADSLYLGTATLSRSANYVSGEAKSYGGVAITSMSQGNYARALEYCLRSLRKLEQTEDLMELAKSNSVLGGIYWYLEEYDKSIFSYQKAVQLLSEIGNKRILANTLYNLGEAYSTVGDFKNASESFNKSIEISEEIGDQAQVVLSYAGLGTIYFQQEKYIESLNSFEEALSVFEMVGNSFYKTVLLNESSRSYIKLGRFSEAKKNLTASLNLAQERGEKHNMLVASELLSITERELGNYAAAYEAHVLYKQMADSVKSEELSKQIDNLELEYAFQQERDSIRFANEREKLMLDQALANQRDLQMLSFGGILVLIIVIIVLYRYYHLKQLSNKSLRKLNQKIKERNASLRALNDEKNSLIGIVAHDLKNPVSNIVQLVDGIKHLKDPKSKEQLLEFIKESGLQLNDMISGILDAEAIEQRLSGVELEDVNLSKTIQSSLAQFEKPLHDKSQQLDIQVEPDLFVRALPNYLPQVVENLLSNAIKFSPRENAIWLSLTEEEHRIVLKVKDEGPGFTEEDKKKLFQKYQRLSAKPTGDESSTGLGLSIVKKFVSAMQADIWVESKSGSGATFYVSFKKSSEEAIADVNALYPKQRLETSV